MSKIYHFSVITCTPHPLRGERINIGIAMVSADGKFGSVRFTPNYVTKLRALAPDVHEGSVSTFIDDFTSRFGVWPTTSRPLDALDASPETLETLATSSGGQIGFTFPRSIMVDGDPDLPMKDLYEQFVGPISSNRPKLFGKPQVRSAIRKSLRELHVPDSDVVMDPPILGIHGESRLDLGVLGTNGHSNQLVMALEPISFAISSQLEILRQRDHVAWVRSDLTQQLAICAVVTPPIANNKVLFDTSLKLLADVDVSVIDVDDVDTLQTTLAHAGASMIEPSLESE